MKQRSRKSSLAPIFLAAAAALSSCALPMAHSQSLRASFSPSTSDAESGFQGVDSSPSSSSSSSSSTSSSSLSAESGPQHIRSQSSSPQPNNKNASPDDDDTNEVEESSLTKPKHFPLTVKLSTSTHHRASNTNNKGGRINSISNGLSNSPEIPLVGIGVGNLPHNKIPYILANALAGAQYQNTIVNKSNSRNNKLTGAEVDDYVNYRLIDTSHTSALEVLVGRSLGRLFGTAGTSVSNSNNLSNGSRNTNNLVKDNTSYHVMIKVWHTHLGYERTMLSIQDSLSDILPGSSGTNASGATSNSAITNSNSHLNNKGIGTLSKSSDISRGKKLSPSSSYPSPNNRIGNTSILIHAILQYPRCYDTLFQSQTYLSSQSYPSSSSSSSSSTANTRHTSCLEEEESLDSTIHATGPSPLLDKDNAWKRSYRALEELYHHGTLESIGVANFETKDMEELYDLATVGPHIYQGSLRTLMTERDLVEGLVKHGVHFQCYDAVSVILGGREVVPRAYGRLERMGARFSGIMQEDVGVDGRGGRPTSGVDDDYGMDGINSSYGYSAIQMVLGWLVQRGVGVLPGTKNLTHLVENGPMSLSTMPEFTPRESLDIENAIMAFVYGVDLEDDSTVLDGNFGVNSETKGRFRRGEFGSEEIVYDETTTEHLINRQATPVDEGVVATFFNALRRNIRIFHVHSTTGRQIQVSGSIPPGRSGRLIVNPRDVLIAYDGYGVAVKKFLVNANHGGRMDFSVEL